jgi:predicted DNA-binding transcriptional regulator AlpA
MSLVPTTPPTESPYNNPDQLLSPKETLEYLRWRYGIIIAPSSFYSMINRKDCPKPTYFRKRPKFRIPDIDEWVRDNLSDTRKNVGV